MSKHWTQAKLPEWVRQSIADDMKEMELRTALAWPTEARPEPAFRIGGYGRLSGRPEPGIYWYTNGYGASELRVDSVTDYSVSTSYKDGNTWRKLSSPQSKFFRTERDARLSRLWDLCEDCANKLRDCRSAIAKAEGKQ